MKRLTRWTVNGVTVLSALLCVAAMGMWARSYWMVDTLNVESAVNTDERPWFSILRSREGGLSLYVFRQHEPGLWVHERLIRHKSFAVSVLSMVKDSEPPIPGFPWFEHQGQTQSSQGDKESVLKYGNLSSGTYSPAGRWDEWRVRYGIVVFLLTILPVVRIARHWFRRARMKPGCCAVCGYDLRASPERCPECGTQRVH